MLDFLRDPIWNGIAGITTIVALILAFTQEKKIKSSTQATTLVLGKAILGIVVIAIGPILQKTMEALFIGGISNVSDEWNRIMLIYGLGVILLATLGFGIFPGTITALAASAGKTNKQVVIRAMLAAFITTSIVDMVMGGGISRLAFNITMNFFGAIVAGAIIGYLIIGFKKAFESADE